MEFKWLNKEELSIKNNRIEMNTPAQTDFFCDYMMKYFHVPVENIIKVGFLAQAPVGNGGTRIYKDLTIKKVTAKNIMEGQ